MWFLFFANCIIASLALALYAANANQLWLSVPSVALFGAWFTIGYYQLGYAGQDP